MRTFKVESLEFPRPVFYGMLVFAVFVLLRLADLAGTWLAGRRPASVQVAERISVCIDACKWQPGETQKLRCLDACAQIQECVGIEEGE